MAKPNYNETMTTQITDQYVAGVDLETIAESIGRSVRSVRSKLVREGVYVTPPKPEKADIVSGPTKIELLTILEATGLDVAGLEGATKDAISRLITAVSH
jgi:hypothetical protein|tara:strand:+ start:324 stop:623 length:300 start_codon:yes stop_codon:yes gene_type:complete